MPAPRFQSALLMARLKKINRRIICPFVFVGRHLEYENKKMATNADIFWQMMINHLALLHVHASAKRGGDLAAVPLTGRDNGFCDLSERGVVRLQKNDKITTVKDALRTYND